MNSILIIDDDVEICLLLSRYLERHKYTVDTAHKGAKGIEKAMKQTYDVVLSDFRLGDMDGREVIQRIKAINPSIPIIIITGYSDIKMAVDVMKLGAFDYLSKPLLQEEVLALIKKALSQPDAVEKKTESKVSSPVKKEEKKQPDEVVVKISNQEYLKTASEESMNLYRQIDLIAPTNYSVILYGESGTGKEVMAKSIHDQSSRKDHPFIAVDCGTLTKELAGSELFGHEKGSFTGAIGSKTGHFEIADKGTLFLDEVANLPIDVQTALLRVIQERRIKKVGGTKEIEVDVRIIVASNENLQDAYKKGKFREDLFHRFNEFSIDIPSLRTRKNDILNFANFFLQQANKELNKNIEGFDEEVKEIFLTYQWPGNLREMRNIIRRTILLTDKGLVNVKSLPSELSVKNSAMERLLLDPPTLKSAAIGAEYEKIQSILKQVNNNKTKAAKLLNIDRKTLYNKLSEYNLLKEEE